MSELRTSGRYCSFKKNLSILCRRILYLLFQIALAYMIIYLLLEHERFQNIRNHTARAIGKEGVTFVVGLILFLSFPGIQLTQLLFGRIFIWIFLKAKLWADWKIFIADFLKRIQIENSLAVYKNQISKILLMVTYLIHFIPTFMKQIQESILY